ncbi:unnamed protein product [Miscanthus lutarioriparius]|uniref:F-box domain-containing protein n=1 Tax=Miscanthus lutarioriparius TaxID=422564 RepID=A0A811RDR4_9POAL|nr:unnamed protein product [Miscanthus lutarioriparius]
MKRTSKRNGSPCQRDDDSQDAETQICLGASLPEDVWCHIHSLMSMRAAARAACVSRAFLHSWRRHPNLIFNNRTLGLDRNTYGANESARGFSSKVDHILKKHSGIGVKKLKIHMPLDYKLKDSCYPDSWLQFAVTLGIEELELALPVKAKYNFPYSFFCNGSGDSIRYLLLADCSFHPTSEVGSLRSLTRLHLCAVSITEDEIGCFISNCYALEQLEIRYCDWIVCLRVPCMLQRLSYLEVLGCSKLRVIDNKAPNISSFYFGGNPKVQLSLGETLKMKNLYMSFSGAIRYVRFELPSSMPNLETVTIYSSREMVDTPMLHGKYLHLKNLSIALNAAASYDYLSLVSFFDACPSLETFVLDASHWKTEHVSIFTYPSDLRRMQEQHHHRIKNVKILNFSSAKSLVELACHVVEHMTSLECLTLETYQSTFRCHVPNHKFIKCSPLAIDILREAKRALMAIRTYIEPKVPSTVELHVVEPCSRCHAVELELPSLG